MKNWIYAALAALFATGCAPHGGYTLTGEVPEAWEGKPVVLFTTDAGQAEAIDSTTVANGKFRLQGVLDAPRNCRVAVYLDPENRSDRNLTVTFPVFLDSTAVNAVCDASKSDPVFTLAGGATQTEWQAYRAALEPLAEERNRAFRDYVEAFYNGGDEAKGIELARRVDEKAGLIRDFKIAYVREHPASAVSLAIVQELCDRQSRLDRAQMESLMDALAPQARESAAGRYAAACIRDKRIVEGQPLPEEPKMLVLGTYGAGETFFTLKGELEAIFTGLRLKKAEYTAVKDNPSYHPGRCAKVSIDGVDVGVMGQVHPLVAANYGIDADVYCAEIDFTKLFDMQLPDATYTPLPKYPTVSRDLSLICSEDVTVAQAEAVITAAAGKLLRDVKLFDIYRGPGVPEGKKSMAFSLELRADDRTLTDTDSEAVVTKVLAALKEKLDAALR